MIKVFGHKAPDTDATCSAIIWTWYLNTHTSQDATAYVLGELNSETKYVLKRWNVEVPDILESVEPGEQVTIVDTNNPQELFENINQCTIVEIIDHHKLIGGLQSEVPMTITTRPLASTASVMYDQLGEHVSQLPTEIAGLILSCILSDTLGFRSPTTTPHDKAIAEKLAAELGVEIDSYANEMFAAKSDVSDFSDAGLVSLDSKKFDIGDKNFRVSVVETTTPETVLARKDGIITAITDITQEEGVDDVLFFVIDIFNEEATVLTHNELTSSIIANSFGVEVTEDTVVLPGIVSRKKQIIPSLKL